MGHTLGFLVHGLPKYQHVERIGHEDVEGLLDKEVYVQEKIDGTNLTVAIVGGCLVIASRNNTLSINGEPDHGFRGAVEYVLASKVPAFLAENPDLILRGEWLVRHALNYDADKMGKFYVFDVQRRIGERNGEVVLEYLDPIDYIPILEPYAIDYIKIQDRGIMTIDRLIELSQVPSDYITNATTTNPSTSIREGIVVKRIGFVNRFGRTVWGKIISREFEEKKALHMHIQNQDPDEIRFAALHVTRELVFKEMAKIGEREGRESTVRDMGELIGRTWHAVFTEELWDFVKKERTTKFDFKQAQRLVTEKVRDIALAYYNRLPEGFNIRPGGETNVKPRDKEKDRGAGRGCQKEKGSTG